jgi:hypothetical protein
MFHRMADKCVRMAKLERNEASRLALLAMAQKWRDLAPGETKVRRLDQLHNNFNTHQMRADVIKRRGGAS